MILSVEETTSAMDVGIVLRPFHALCQAVFTAARRRAFLIIDKRKFQMGLWQIHERSKWFKNLKGGNRFEKVGEDFSDGNVSAPCFEYRCPHGDALFWRQWMEYSGDGTF